MAAASALRNNGFVGKIVDANSPDYKVLSERASDISLQTPRFIVQPVSSKDVSVAVRFATQFGLGLAVKCGGHHFSKVNAVDDGVVIDMGSMKDIKIDKANNQVTIGGGCLWGDVYPALQAEGLSCVGGGVNVVGCGGHITGGGYGPLCRQYGLACDNVLSMTVVIADGSIVTASEHENPDLSWAIKGSSSSFGVVTQFVLRTYPAMKHVRQMVADESPVPFLYFVRGPPPKHEPALVLLFSASGKPEEYEDVFEPFLQLEEKPFSDDVKICKNVVELTHALDPMLLLGGRRKLGASVPITGLPTGMSDDLWQRFVDYTDSTPDAIDTKVFFEFHNSARLRPELSSIPITVERHGMLIICEEHNDAGNDDSAIAWSKEMAAVVRSYQVKDGGDLGYSGNGSTVMNLRSEDIYGPNLPRLQEVKAKYDPNNVFNRWHRIVPDYSGTEI